jgi:hypothetical protein
VLRPVYVWSNLSGSSPAELTVNGQGDIQDKIVLGREVFCDAGGSPGSCNNGVRVGPVASLPATCTTGQAYWATDDGEWNSSNAGPDGQLYQCTSTNTWAPFYKPYQYPHPWAGGPDPMGTGGGGAGGMGMGVGGASSGAVNGGSGAGLSGSNGDADGSSDASCGCRVVKRAPGDVRWLVLLALGVTCARRTRRARR